ncbi:MAG: peptidoglycan-associated lipoprotein Pal [Lysobacteraceae bacterium]
MNTTSRILLAVVAALAVSACTKKTQVVETAPEPTPTPVVTPTAPVDDRYTPESLDTDSCLRQRVIYFDFDQSNVRSEAAAQIACHAKYLRDRPSARITLEGHADERGSREYNLGLGERRGNAVNQALIGSGGAASQLTVVSYGEERPVALGSSETSWQQNRRVEIVYTAR